MTRDAARPFPELGCYGLAGHTATPRVTCSTRCASPSDSGIGSVFLSERFNVKDAGVLAGAAGAVSETHRDRAPPRPTTTPGTRWSPRRWRPRCTGSPAVATRSASAAASTCSST